MHFCQGVRFPGAEGLCRLDRVGALPTGRAIPSHPPMPAETATLLIHCPDRPGLVHDVTGFIFAHEGNIVDLQQHIDGEAFFMRLEWSLERFTLEPDEIAQRLQPMARRHEMRLQLHFSSRRKREIGRAHV